MVVTGNSNEKIKNYGFLSCCLVPCGCKNREKSRGEDQTHQMWSYSARSSNNAAAVCAAVTVEVNGKILMLYGDGLGGGGKGK